MFTDEVQKLSADVCLYIHAEGRIKPNYVSLSVLAAVLYGVSNHTTKVHLNKVALWQAVPFVSHRKTLFS